MSTSDDKLCNAAASAAVCAQDEDDNISDNQTLTHGKTESL